jgi:ABC-type glycerol-3-phosphate transport system permease component
MPTVKPAWLTLVIFAVQNLWSMGPSTLIYSENLKTLNYALGQIISGGIARSGVATAIVVLMMSVPITVFVFTQSQVIETMSSSGIKE